jgi:hypothetical protein
MLKPLLKDGKLVRSYEGIDAIRSRAAKGLHELAGSKPSLSSG